VSEACKALLSAWQAACSTNKNKAGPEMPAEGPSPKSVQSPVAAAMTKRLQWSVPFGDETSKAIMVSGKKQKMRLKRRIENDEVKSQIYSCSIIKFIIIHSVCFLKYFD
jgi:hypothetical protein